MPEIPAGAAFTMPGRHHVQERSSAAELPGPASYDVAGAAAAAAVKAPSWTMGARSAGSAAGVLQLTVYRLPSCGAT